MLTTICESRLEMLHPANSHHGAGWLSPIQHAAWLGLWAGERQFARAARNVQDAQWGLLKRVLASQAASQYGRGHGFDKITSVRQFQANVPVVEYETLKPWIAQIAGGRRNVLTCDTVHALRRSAGHGGAPKLLPQTDGLLQQVGAALRPWLHSWLTGAPSLLRRTFYWEMPRPGAMRCTLTPGCPTAVKTRAIFWVGWRVGRCATISRCLPRSPTWPTYPAGGATPFLVCWPPSSWARCF